MPGLSHKGYVSKPPLPEVREANRQHQQAEKKRKDKAMETAARKRERRKKHDKECAQWKREGLSPPTMPESIEEEDSSTGRVDFSESEDFEVVTVESPPPAQPWARVEASASVLGERSEAFPHKRRLKCDTNISHRRLIYIYYIRWYITVTEFRKKNQ